METAPVRVAVESPRGGEARHDELIIVRQRLQTRREQKAWRDWYFCHIKSIRDEILSRMPPVDIGSADILRNQLNRCTKYSTPPDFSVSGARSGYVLERLEARTAFLPEVLVQASMRPLLDDLVWRAFNNPVDPSARGTLVGNSYGGGPGFDVLGLALLFPQYLRPYAEHKKQGRRAEMHIEGRIYDNEEGWNTSVASLHLFLKDGQRHWHEGKGRRPKVDRDDDDQACAEMLGGSPAVSSCLQQDISLGTARFDTCDVTDSIETGLNRGITKEVLRRTHLHVFMYVLVENLLSVRNKDYKFVRDVLANTRPGAVVCVFDSSPKMFPEIIALVNIHDRHACKDAPENLSNVP
jgi:hypothetical protein